MTAELPVLDMGAPAFWSNMHAPLAEALAQSPVAQATDRGWVVLGAAETDALLREPTTRSVDLLARGGITDGPLHDWWSQVMFSTNPPEHTRLRALVSRAFTPRQAELMRSTVEQITNDLLAPHLATGIIDLVDDVAHHIPIRVMGALLDVPEDDFATFADWTADLGLVFSSMVNPDLRTHLESVVQDLGSYVQSLIAQRRTKPGDDLLSQLIVAEEAGDRLSEPELVAMVQNLLFAGHDTTRSLLQIALAVLLQHPDEAALLIDDASRAPAVVEEVLRWEAPVFGTARETGIDMNLGGVAVPAGESVSVVLPAANRDPRRYENPHDFLPDRWLADEKPLPPLSFGQGAHFCIGAALARVEAQVSLPLILQTLPNLALDEDPQWVPYAAIRRYTGLPAGFTGGVA